MVDGLWLFLIMLHQPCELERRRESTLKWRAPASGSPVTKKPLYVETRAGRVLLLTDVACCQLETFFTSTTPNCLSRRLDQAALHGLLHI